MKKNLLLISLSVLIIMCFCAYSFATESTSSIYYKDGKFYSDSTFSIEMAYSTIEDVINNVENNTIIYIYSCYELAANETWGNASYTVTLQRDSSFTTGAIVSVPDSCFLEIGENVIIDGNSIQATKSGILVDGELTLNGGIIQNCINSSAGGGLNVNGKLNIISGAIQYNYSATHGGGINAKNAEITMSGGSICYNSTKVSQVYTGSTGWGGGAYLYYTTFTMTGGHIDNNAGRIGGGLKIDGCTVVISGGTINYNTALGYDGSGGGIYSISGSTLSLSNCEIVGNEAETNGGGIFPDSANEKVSVSGKVIIKDNIGYYLDSVNGSANDLYLPVRGGSLVTIEVTGPLEGSYIGVFDAGVAYSGKSPSNFVTNYTTYNDEISPNTYFFTNLDNYKISSGVDENGGIKIEKCYIVLFYNGTEVYYKEEVAENGVVSEPSQPMKTGYTFEYWSTTENGSEYDFSNSITAELTLYAVWKENEVIIEYILSIPSDASSDCATMSITSETINAVTGIASGTTISLETGYKFVGWYDSNNILISNDIDWKPEKDEFAIWESQTYTAKIEYLLVDISINVSNSLSPNQEYIFAISGVPDDGSTFNLLRIVIISNENGDGSVTIKDVPAGIYTVALENDWNWRYEENVKSLNVDNSKDTHTINFEEFSIKNNYWLNGYNYYHKKS